MKGRLIYVVGPSGAGKDSVIDYARAHLPAAAAVVFARRTITRPASAGGEDHRAVDEAGFERLLAQGAFAMHWRANGLAYGIGVEILDRLAEGRTVVVSGSRGHLPEAIAAFPGIETVLVTAKLETLRARLGARGREDATQVTQRLERAASLTLPPGLRAFRIDNDGELAAAGGRLAGYLSAAPVA